MSYRVRHLGKVEPLKLNWQTQLKASLPLDSPIVWAGAVAVLLAWNSGSKKKNPADEFAGLIGVAAVAGMAIYVLYEISKSSLFNPQFPGGGETPGTSETYTGALSEFLSHPLDTLTSIFGGNAAQGNAPAITPSAPSGNPGLILAGSQPVTTPSAGLILSGANLEPIPTPGSSGGGGAF